MDNQKRKTAHKKSNPFVPVFIVALVIIALVGIIVYASGYRYINADGVKYSGFVENGQPVNGNVKYPDGITGKLTKENDSANGMIVYSTGDVFEGEIKGILRHGRGTITYKQTGEIYSGDFVEDKLTGYAECTSPDGSSYSGEVLDGKKHGVGKHIYPDGSYYYGEFADNKRNGAGEQHYADGSYYYGTFADDKRQGSGIVTVNLENGMMYKGECKFVFANGDIYVGDFASDRRTGKGKYTWATGQTYEGDFLSDKMHGMGTYDFKNGKQPYTGEFVNGQLKEEIAE